MERVGVQLVAEDAAAFTRAMQGAEKGVQDFARETERAAKVTIDANGRMRDEHGRFIQGATKNNQTFASSAREAGQAFRSGFSEIIVGGLREVGALGTRALVDVTRAVAGFAKDSISAAGDFEAGMNRLASVTGSALAEAGFSLDDAKNKALELGKETAFSAGQAQEAMIALAKGGVPIADIMGTATDATLGLAAAGELELASAAEIVAKQLGVWAETGVTATQVSDLLAQAANASTVDVDELALGLANAGGAAKAAGVDYDDLVQTMALIAPGFSSAADAGTSLKTFLLNLEPTTKPATAAMRELGLITEDGSNKFFDAAGNFVGMSEASQVLQTAMVGLSDQQRATALETIFGSDAIRTADSLARAGAEGFAAMGVSMGAAGTAAEQATAKNQGFNFAMETLKGSVETLQIVIGTALLPALVPFIDLLTSGANVLLEYATGGKTLSASLMEMQVAMTGIIGAGAAEEITRLIEALLRGGPASEQFADAIGHAAQRVGDWAAEAIPTAIAGAGAVVGGIVTRLIDASPEIVDAVGSWRQGFLDWAVEALPGALQSLGELVGGLLDAIGAKAPEIGAVVATWGAAFAGWATEAVPPMLGELGGLVAELGSWIAARIPDIAAQVGEWGIAFIQWAPEASAGMLVAVGGLLIALLGWIVGSTPEITATLLEWSLAFAAWVATEAIPALLVELAGLGLEVLSWIAKAAGEITGETIQLAKAMYEWVASKTAGELLAELDGLAADILGWIAGLGPQMASDMQGAGQSAIDGLVNAISGGVGALASAGARIASSFLAGLTGGLDSHSPSRKTYEEGQNAVAGFVNALAAGAAPASAAGEQMAGAVVSAAEAGAAATTASMGAIIPLLEGLITTYNQTGMASAEYEQATRDLWAVVKDYPDDAVRNFVLVVEEGLRDGKQGTDDFKASVDELYTALYDFDTAGAKAAAGLDATGAATIEAATAVGTLIPLTEDMVLAFEQGGIESEAFHEALGVLRREGSAMGVDVSKAIEYIVASMQDAGVGSIEYGETIENLYEKLYSIDQASSAAAAGVTGITGAVASAAPAMQEAGTALVDGLARGIEQQGDRAAETTEKVKQGVQKAVEPLKPAMRDVGENAGQALADGIKSKKGAAQEAGEELGEAAEEGTQNAFDSHSPSRVFQDLGIFAGDGLTLGIEASVPRAREAGAKLATDTRDAVGETLTPDAMHDLGTDAMLGIVDALTLIAPDIESLGAQIAGDLVDQFSEAAEAIAATIEETQAAALGGTASMSRQLQQNRKLLREIGADPYALEQMQREFAELDKNRTPENFGRRAELAGLIAEQNARKELAASTQQQIAELEAERVEGAKTDKKAAAELFAFRSRQVQEEAKLRLDLIQATTQAERDALLEQIDLTRQAQADELAAFRFDQEVAQSDAKNPASQLRDLQTSVTDLAVKANDRYTFEEKAARTGIGANGKRISKEDQDKYQRGLSGTKLFRDEITAFSQRLNQATQTGQFDYDAFKAEADRLLAEYRGGLAPGQASPEQDRRPRWWPDKVPVPSDVDHRQGRLIPERWKHAWTVPPGATGPEYIGPTPPPPPGGLVPPIMFGDEWVQNATGVWATRRLPYYHQGGRGVPMGMAVLKNDEFVMNMRGGENIVPMSQMQQLMGGMVRPAAAPPPIQQTTTTTTTDARSYTFAPQYGGPAPSQTMDYNLMRTLSL